MALVLRRFRYRESSLVCHVLTPTQGRVSILAKGAYRPKSAYSGVLDLFDTLRLTWSPARDLGSLREGAIEERRRNLSRDLNRYRAGLRVLELARLGAREGHEENELFELTCQALDALQSCNVEPGLVSAVHDLKFLRAQGLTPALLVCAQCGERANEDRTRSPQAEFSPALGGRLCARCAGALREQGDPERFRGRRRGKPLLETHPRSVIQVAQSLLDTPWSRLPQIRLDEPRTESLRAFVRRFLEYHLETRPRVVGPLPRRTGHDRSTAPR